MKKQYVYTIIAVVVVGVVAFFGGMKYGQSSRVSRFGANGRGGFFMQQVNQAFRPVRGQVISSDSGTLTIKLQDGSSKIVVLSDKTSFIKSTSASRDDIKTGDTVIAVGTANSDGSVTADQIQIIPPQLRNGVPGATMRNQ